MPSFNISIPAFRPEDLDDEKQRRRILGYMAALNEQLRYLLNNLDEDNLSAGLSESISDKASAKALSRAEEQLGGMAARVSAVENETGSLSTRITQTDRAITLEATRATEAEGTLRTSLEVTAEGLRSLAEKTGAEGLAPGETLLSLIEQMPEVIRLAVGRADGDINEFRAGSTVEITEAMVRIASALFLVEINNAGQVFRLDESGGTMMDMAILNRLTAPNMAEKYAGAPNVTVGPGGDFATLGGLAEALNGKRLTGHVVATLTGDLTESAALDYITGGALDIDGDGHTLTGALTIMGCGTLITITDLTVNGKLMAYNDAYICLLRDTLNGAGNSTQTDLLDIAGGTRLHAEDCEFYNATNLIKAGTCSDVTLIGNRGGNGAYFLCGAGAAVKVSVTRPDGAVYTASACLYAPSDPAAVTIDYGSATPPQPVVDPTQTAALSCANSGTHYPSGHWFDGGDDKRIRQGYTDMGSSGKHELQGCMWFDTTAIAGHTVLSAALTLRRAAGYGRSSEVSVRLYTTPLATTSGDPLTGATDQGLIGTIGNGETKRFAIPAAAVQALADGTAAGLMLQINDGALISGRTYSANYAHFYGYGETVAPVLDVTYQ